MKRIFTVTGMSCAACSARVEKAVRGVPGVEDCAVSLLTNEMSVEGPAVGALAGSLGAALAPGPAIRGAVQLAAGLAMLLAALRMAGLLRIRLPAFRLPALRLPSRLVPSAPAARAALLGPAASLDPVRPAFAAWDGPRR